MRQAISLATHSQAWLGHPPVRRAVEAKGYLLAALFERIHRHTVPNPARPVSGCPFNPSRTFVGVRSVVHVGVWIQANGCVPRDHAHDVAALLLDTQALTAPPPAEEPDERKPRKRTVRQNSKGAKPPRSAAELLAEARKLTADWPLAGINATVSLGWVRAADFPAKTSPRSSAGPPRSCTRPSRVESGSREPGSVGCCRGSPVAGLDA